ncbi:unnamed protein product [Trichogramma brassicae]|uniref:Uncharacterized protein n=1 Tax=Trichogramma brassicae TaxID=86971 RepID=A0A6H5HXD1_9HYME|nr:unnamed protein product [Trichogramma brassicae]
MWPNGQAYNRKVETPAPCSSQSQSSLPANLMQQPTNSTVASITAMQQPTNSTAVTATRAPEEGNVDMDTASKLRARSRRGRMKFGDSKIETVNRSPELSISVCAPCPSERELYSGLSDATLNGGSTSSDNRKDPRFYNEERLIKKRRDLAEVRSLSVFITLKLPYSVAEVPQLRQRMIREDLGSLITKVSATITEFSQQTLEIPAPSTRRRARGPPPVVQQSARDLMWSKNEIEPQLLTVSKTSMRQHALDAFHGIAVLLMIFVNEGGEEYVFLNHAPWNGLTVADLVLPCWTLSPFYSKFCQNGLPPSYGAERRCKVLMRRSPRNGLFSLQRHPLLTLNTAVSRLLAGIYRDNRRLKFRSRSVVEPRKNRLRLTHCIRFPHPCQG